MNKGLMFYICDTETNGLSIKDHEICEYSIIRAFDRVQLSRQVKVDKVKNSSYDALQITGKKLSDLYSGISKIKAIEDLHEFIERDNSTPDNRCLVGHNISFDRRFLHHLWKEHNQDFPIDLFLDTVPMCKRLAAKMGKPKAKVKLEMALDLFGIKKMAGLHTAKGDTRNTYFLWEHLLKSNIEYLDLIKQFPQRKIQESTDYDTSEFEEG